MPSVIPYDGDWVVHLRQFSHDTSGVASGIKWGYAPRGASTHFFSSL